MIKLTYGVSGNYQTTQWRIPEHCIFNIYQYGNLKPHIEAVIRK